MIGSRGTLVAVIVGLSLGALAGASVFFAWPTLVRSQAAAVPRHPKFTEVRWPFPTDEWGKGKAFRCVAADCGGEVSVYIRAKIGFCNCLTGVADDNELDRLTDFGLMGERLSVLGPGREIKVAWMNGRSRAFKVGGAPPAGQSALSVGFNDHCDAIVATAVHGAEQSTAVEPVVLEFLNSKTVIGWAEVALGL